MCHYAERRDLFIIMLNVVMLSVVVPKSKIAKRAFRRHKQARHVSQVIGCAWLRANIFAAVTNRTKSPNKAGAINQTIHGQTLAREY
jgi:hypothetical protein